MNDTKYMLQGGVDLHTHCGPDFCDRSVDQIELAENAKKEKMAAVVLKNHFCPTFFTARQVAKTVPGIRVFGGVVLNKYVGGLNVDAVDLAVKAGAKVVWMPTLSAANHIVYHGASHHQAQKAKTPLRQEGSGLSICEDGRLKPEVFEILAVIAGSIRHFGAKNCVLVTDLGQAQNEIPTEALKRFVKGLFESGITPEEIQIMLCKNPCSLLGIN